MLLRIRDLSTKQHKSTDHCWSKPPLESTDTLVIGMSVNYMRALAMQCNKHHKGVMRMLGIDPQPKTNPR